MLLRNKSEVHESTVVSSTNLSFHCQGPIHPLYFPSIPLPDCSINKDPYNRMAESTKALQAFLFAQELARRFPHAIGEIEEILLKKPADHASPTSMRAIASLLGFQRDLIERFNIFLPKGISLQIWQNPDQVSVILLVNHDKGVMNDLGCLSNEALIHEGCSTKDEKSIASQSTSSTNVAGHPERNAASCQDQNATTDPTLQINTTGVTLLNKVVMATRDSGIENSHIHTQSTNTSTAELQLNQSQLPVATVAGKKCDDASHDVNERKKQSECPRGLQHQSKILAKVNDKIIAVSICDDKTTGPGIVATTPAMRFDEVCVSTITPVQIMPRQKSRGRGRPRKESLEVVCTTNAIEFLEQLGTKELDAILRHLKWRSPKKLHSLEELLLQVKETLQVKDDTKVQNLPAFVLSYRYNVHGENGKEVTKVNASSAKKRKSNCVVPSPSSHESRAASAKRVTKNRKTFVLNQNGDLGHAEEVLSSPQLPSSPNKIDEPVSKKPKFYS